MKNPDSGIYQLIIELTQSFEISIRSFPTIILEPGYYIYTGSARMNLRKRIERHLKKNKNTHWHIDYLTIHEGAIAKKVVVFDPVLENARP